MEKQEDVVFMFGPEGRFQLHIPINKLDDIRQTAYSFMEAGVAMQLYADELDGQPVPQKTPEQLLFDWNE